MPTAKPLSGRPLFATPGDAAMYVPPTTLIDRIERAVARELNTLIIGERGAGKTTLLQQMMLRWRDHASGRAAVYLDASIARSALDVVDLLRDELGVPAHVGENVAAGMRAAIRPGAAGAREATELITRLRPLRETDPTVVFLDGLASAEIAHTLFGRLRDELWALPMTWVVAADADQRGAFLVPPADAFFEAVVSLEPLTPKEQLEVLRRRLPEDWRSVTRLVGTADRTPRQLLSAAREALLDQRPIETVLEAEAARKATAAALGRTARMVLSELEALGRPVAASDEELLERLGVTRERTNQVLREMERNGLLESFSEPSPRGRPRKLYKLRDGLPPGPGRERE